MPWDLSAIAITTPAGEAAHRILRSAIDEMQQATDHLLESDDHENEVEDIHKLRVWSRRAGAALDLFEKEFDSEFLAKTRKWLRRLRKSAGKTRDCDVLIQRLRKQHAGETGHQAKMDGSEIAVNNLKHQRKQKHAKLIKVLKRASKKELWIWWRRKLAVPASLDGAPKPTLAAVALETLPMKIHEFLALSKANHCDWVSIHELRIVGKGLRYSLEILDVCLKTTLAHASLKALCDFQDRLGVLNDSHNAERQIRKIARNQIAERRRATLKGLANSFKLDRSWIDAPADLRDLSLESLLDSLLAEIAAQKAEKATSAATANSETVSKTNP